MAISVMTFQGIWPKLSFFSQRRKYSIQLSFDHNGNTDTLIPVKIGVLLIIWKEGLMANQQYVKNAPSHLPVLITRHVCLDFPRSGTGRIYPYPRCNITGVKTVINLSHCKWSNPDWGMLEKVFKNPPNLFIQSNNLKPIAQSHKTHNTLVTYPTTQRSQTCAHNYSELCIVGYGCIMIYARLIFYANVPRAQWSGLNHKLDHTSERGTSNRDDCAAMLIPWFSSSWRLGYHEIH